MNTTDTGTIDLGGAWWRVPSVDGIGFGSRDGAIAYCQQNGKDPAGLALVDTRLTIRAVKDILAKAENDACGLDPKFSGCAGPWNEVFSSFLPGKR